MLSQLKRFIRSTTAFRSNLTYSRGAGGTTSNFPDPQVEERRPSIRYHGLLFDGGQRTFDDDNEAGGDLDATIRCQSVQVLVQRGEGG